MTGKSKDLFVALAWVGFGAAVTTASWRMDRLADRGIEPWSAPGLLPGVIGALIVLLGIALGWRALRASAADDGAPAPSLRRTLLAGALCIAFAAGALGRGVPFVVAGAAFVFVFIALFSLDAWRAEGRVARGAAQALVIAVVAAGSIALLFERVFLVRLP